ncbi:MAG: response regulator transcription factor [Bacteroidales bacterium]|nr:response regulator transcription factor [Bacteroidales bacterium]
MKILVVDDEQDICEILQYNLEIEGYDVDTANSAEEAMLLPLHQYSLMLLDVMMGDISGFEMAKKVKEKPETADIPIIFITALDSEDDIVNGLNLGADDYIPKPLSMKQVKARVAAVLRRAARVPSESAQESSSGSLSCFNFETLCLDIESKEVTLDGQPVQLTKLEFELLSLFLQNINKVFSREELLSRCWPQDVYVLDRTVDVNITRLRKKIGQYGKHIKTRVGYGYSFCN